MEFWQDTQVPTNDKPSSWFIFGPKCTANNIYQLSPSEVSSASLCFSLFLSVSLCFFLRGFNSFYHHS